MLATITFIDNLKNDTELDDVKEIRNFMIDREDWRKMKSGRISKIRYKKVSK